MARKHHTAKTTERGLGWEWQKRRLRVLRRDNYLCQPCLREGRTTAASEVDHIAPRAKAGAAVTDDGCQSICGPCHEACVALHADEATLRARLLDGARPLDEHRADRDGARLLRFALPPRGTGGDPGEPSAERTA